MSNNVPLILYSDKGSQYPSAGYQSLLKDCNVAQSMLRAGTHHDCAGLISALSAAVNIFFVSYRQGKDYELIVPYIEDNTVITYQVSPLTGSLSAVSPFSFIFGFSQFSKFLAIHDRISR